MKIPDDLMETELGMSAVKRIIEIRKVSAAAGAILKPSAAVVEGAKARIQWAADAEMAVKEGKPEPLKPGESEPEPEPEAEKPKAKAKAK